MNNKVILRQMIRLSRIIKDLREARAKLLSVRNQTEYFIIEGQQSDLIKNKTKQGILDCYYIEKYLRWFVSNSCKYLDGFNGDKMESIDYISSSDVKNKFVDICAGKRIVATIDLTTGIIKPLNEPESEEMAEEKRPTEKS